MIWRKKSGTDSRNAVGLRRLALTLLLVMLGLSGLAAWGQDRWPLLEWVGAFAQAGAAGALADWFAVVALFRHPLGLPIPHTAILPRRRDSLAQSLGTFICTNFLAPDLVSERLRRWKPSVRLAEWLGDARAMAAVAHRVSSLLPSLLGSLDGDAAQAVRLRLVKAGLVACPAGPALQGLLGTALVRNWHFTALDWLLLRLEEWLAANPQALERWMEENSWQWVPRWIDHRLAGALASRGGQLLVDLRQPDHPWRDAIELYLHEVHDRLGHDPIWLARCEAAKEEMLATQAFADFTAQVGAEMVTAGKNIGLSPETLSFVLMRLGHRLASDERAQAVGDRWIERMVVRGIVPRRDDIAEFIAGVVRRWDAETLTTKLERHIGRDLQYIRLNGTIVGALAGLLLHAVAMLLR